MLGTECGRQCIDQNIWVNKWKEKVEKVISPLVGGMIYLSPVVIADDVRFDNEALAVKELGGMVVELVTPSQNEGVDDKHASEAGISPELVDKTYFLKFGLEHISRAVEDFYQNYYMAING